MGCRKEHGMHMTSITRRRRPDTTSVRQVPMFAGLDRRTLERLATHTDVVRLPAGRTVVEAGRTAQQFLVLLDGEALALDGSGRRRSLEPGAQIGADELAARRPFDHTVVTSTDATFVVVEGPAFRGWTAVTRTTTEQQI
jgi:CRP-like cAMP-binding protein